MKLTESIRSERGVSPVIGVILMVAITVILAAVIGSFVLGIGGDIEQTPQATLDIQYDDDGANNLTITHEGGDTLQWDNLNVTAEGEELSEFNVGGELSPGYSKTRDLGSPLEDGDTVRVVHSPSGGVIVSQDVDL